MAEFYVAAASFHRYSPRRKGNQECNCMQQKSWIRNRVKSGGHDYDGLSFRTQNGNPFVMFDLHNLNATEINLEEESIWIQTGVMLGELYYKIAQNSNVHAFPGGLCPGVGSGWHISGGVFVTLLRKMALLLIMYWMLALWTRMAEYWTEEQWMKICSGHLGGGGGVTFGVILAWKLKMVRVPDQGFPSLVPRQKIASKALILEITVTAPTSHV
ncbi:tetrahydrocannabinolic acid synthase-like [Olea europaea subsp. europaea]|uniref:Tetrahydrocannabinolic acid synthase-like n=1 Tax=Olea europaea subsp. europaea TaxID=158383 RepID=A0A8S0QA47_OLEEU|nr:tetrahydrocannabinolic acid synthase-like [Olea europaea subsp. europaea]